MIGKLFISHSTTRGSAEFSSVPFNGASIDWSRTEASTLSFKSPLLFEEGDRVRYKTITGDDWGGQIYKVKGSTQGDYEYECISYLRLYHDKVTCSYSNMTSSQIMKKVLGLSKNDFSTAGITNTEAIHTGLKWENTSIWEIALQLCWLEHQAGYEVRAYVNADGTLEFGYTPEQKEGYIFNNAFSYEEEHDSSDLITQYTVTYNGQTIASASANNELLAKWGYVGEVSECPTNSTSSSNGSSTKSSKATSLKDSSQISKYNIASSVVNQALSIAKVGNSDYNNMKLLYNWVNKHIKYSFYQNTKYGAKGTLSHRKGNCCDNANLLIALARSIGIKCRYCHAHRSGKGHVYGEYKLNGKWVVIDTGTSSTSKYWGGHSNYAGGTTARYDTLPF